MGFSMSASGQLPAFSCNIVRRRCRWANLHIGAIGELFGATRKKLGLILTVTATSSTLNAIRLARSNRLDGTRSIRARGSFVLASAPYWQSSVTAAFCFLQKPGQRPLYLGYHRSAAAAFRAAGQSCLQPFLRCRHVMLHDAAISRHIVLGELWHSLVRCARCLLNSCCTN
jgi:hypothetical protein